MIQANELRIGNLIEFKKHDPSQIYSKPKWELMEVTYGDHSNIVSRPNDFRPIPLTEEWIEKFGFVYDKVFDIYSNKSGHELMFVKDGYIEFYLYEYGGPFKCVEYVHQLQNLYFALTQTELELKQI